MGSPIQVQLNKICKGLHMHSSYLPRPTLILVMGVAGSGKTVLAKGILRKLAATYLDNNFIVDAFFPDTRSAADYLEMRPRFYEVLYRIAEENLHVGNSVLVDAPHIRQVRDAEWVRFLDGLVERTDAALAALRCHCSERTLRERLERRGERRDAAKLSDWKGYLSEQPPRVDIPFEHLDIDTEEPLAEIVERAVQYILDRSGRP